MDITLKLAFTGLCAFHPHKGGKEMWAFLVDARTAENSCGYSLHAHTPLLSFALGNLEDYCEITYAGGIAIEKCLSKGTAKFPGTVTVDSQGRHIAHLALAKETIQLSQPKAANLKLKKTSGSSGSKPNDQKGDRNDFRWTVGLTDVFPAGSDYAKPADACISDPKNSNLVARLNLTDGEATSGNVGLDTSGDYFAWKFHHGGKVHEQTLADQVQVAIPGFNDIVIIELIPFGASPQLPARKIILKALRKKDLVDLAVSNLPTPTFSHVGSTGMPQILPHFAWFYKLSKIAPPAPCPIPTVLSPAPFIPLTVGSLITTLTITTGGGDVFCPMTRF